MCVCECVQYYYHGYINIKIYSNKLFTSIGQEINAIYIIYKLYFENSGQIHGKLNLVMLN